MGVIFSRLIWGRRCQNQRCVRDSNICLFMAVLSNIADFSQQNCSETISADFPCVHASQVQCQHAVSSVIYFGVSRLTVSWVFNGIITVMGRCPFQHWLCGLSMNSWGLQYLPFFPQKSYQKCAWIIDCFEISIERASDLKVWAHTF